MSELMYLCYKCCTYQANSEMENSKGKAKILRVCKCGSHMFINSRYIADCIPKQKK